MSDDRQMQPKLRTYSREDAAAAKCGFSSFMSISQVKCPPQRIRAAVLNSAPGGLDIEQLTLRDPGRGEVLIRVEYAGLCHSDLHEMDGTHPTSTPVVLGHEAAGVVEAVGPNVSGVAPGDHVVTCLAFIRSATTRQASATVARDHERVPTGVGKSATTPFADWLIANGIRPGTSWEVYGIDY